MICSSLCRRGRAAADRKDPLTRITDLDLRAHFENVHHYLAAESGRADPGEATFRLFFWFMSALSFATRDERPAGALDSPLGAGGKVLPFFA